MSVLSDYAEEPCDVIAVMGAPGTSASVAVCLRPKGHGDEHIGMMGPAGSVIVNHWGTMEEMTKHLSEIQGVVR